MDKEPKEDDDLSVNEEYGSEGEEDYEMEDSDEVEADIGEKRVYLPGGAIATGEELVCDKTAYNLFHEAKTGSPCLSFDILRDSLGDNREDYPHTMYMVAGSQSDISTENHIYVMKMEGLSKVKKLSSDDEDDDSSDSDDEDAPVMHSALIKHHGGVNRLRCTKFDDKSLAATWSEAGKVNIYDLSLPLEAVNDSQSMKLYEQQKVVMPIFKFGGCPCEGFALDWSPTRPGYLAMGDCAKNIFLMKPQEGGWHVDQRPFVGHSASVEDIQWSPNEQSVFASCSVDKSIRIWDTRAAPSKACMITVSEAHDRDVNVISWNRNDPFIVSGGDDGMIKVWDLRTFEKSKPAGVFKHHTKAITSVEWHPTDSSVLVASGDDDQITLWDLAVELDKETTPDPEIDVPPQLLFIHQGQTAIKEVHWHPQIPGLLTSTANSGFNIFQTISVA